MQAYKKFLIKSGALLISILVILTLFSNTIYSINLPDVTLDYPHDGIITNKASGEGTIEFSESEALYATDGGSVELLVKVGDAVMVGCPLYSIEADTESLRQSLDTTIKAIAEIAVNISKTQSDIDYYSNLLLDLDYPHQDTDIKINSEILGYEREIETLSQSLRSYKNQDSDMPISMEIIGYEQEIESLSVELEHETDVLQKMQILYDFGGISNSEFIVQQNKVNGIKTHIDQVLNKKENYILRQIDETKNQIVQITKERENAVLLQKQNIKNSTEAAQKDYKSKAQDLNKTINDLSFQLQSQMLQKQMQEETTDNLNKQIANGGKQTIQADKNGIVIAIGADMDKTNYINKNSLVMKLGLSDSPLQATAAFRDNVDFMNAGDTVTVNIKARQQYNLQGTLDKIIFEDGSLKATILFSAVDCVNGGEKAEVSLVKTSDIYKNILPNSAIRQDSDGFFILYTEQVKGRFGYEYYAKRAMINILAQDTVNTAFNMVSDDRLSVIVNSDKPVSENDRLRIVGGGDLLAIR